MLPVAVFPLVSLDFLISTFLFVVGWGSLVALSWLCLQYLFPELSTKDTSYRWLITSVVAIVVFTGSAYIMGYAQLRWLQLLYIPAGLRAVYKCLLAVKWRENSKWFDFQKGDWWSWGISIVGILCQLLTISTSGILSNKGLTFFRLNGWDGMLHLSFAEFMKVEFPPQQPGAVGLALTNYHYWADLFVAEFSRLFAVPVIHVYFHFIPFVVAILIAIAVYQLAKVWGGSVVVRRWALFFYFFAGNATYLFMWLLHQGFGWNSPAIDHGLLLFLNMPQAFARLGLLTGLILIAEWLQTKQLKWLVLSCIILASLFGYKIYFGLFGAIGLGSLLAVKLTYSFVTELYQQRSLRAFKTFFAHHYPVVLIGVLFVVMSLAIFLPPNRQSGGLFLAPLVWPKILLGQTNLDWNEWWLRRQVYEAYSNTRNLIIMDGIAIAVFMLSIYATRLIGMLPTLNLIKRDYGAWLLLVWWPMWLFTFLGMNTLQSSGGANVFNFFIVALVVGGITTAFWIEKVLRWPMWLSWPLLMIVVLISLPRPLQDTYLFIKSAAVGEESLVISPDELKALSFIKTATPRQAVIQTHLKNHIDAETPYGSYLSQRYSYVSGRGILRSHNQPVTEREAVLLDLSMPSLKMSLGERLVHAGIDYYIVRKDKNNFEQLWFPWQYALQEGVEVVYQNETVTVVKPRLQAAATRFVCGN
ncbi:MAG TPA: hypothetical protein VD999_04485 [Vitreimonas sp.]|nr:hypothetical protein [Vitreimonas sp.]